MIAVKFHKVAYEERIKTLRRHLNLLNTLNGVVHRRLRRGKQQDITSSAKNLFTKKLPNLHSTFSLHPSHQQQRKTTSTTSVDGSTATLLSTPQVSTDSLPPSPRYSDQPDSKKNNVPPTEHSDTSIKESAPPVLDPQPKGLGGHIKAMAQNAQHGTYHVDAKREAKRIFYALLSSKEKEILLPADFVDAYTRDSSFKSSPQAAKEAAMACFQFFDRDNNGDISKAEMKDCIVSVYKESRHLAASLRDLNSAVGKLNRLFNVISFTVIVFLWVLLFNEDKNIMNQFLS